MARRTRQSLGGVAVPLPPEADRAAYREAFLARVGSIRSFHQGAIDALLRTDHPISAIALEFGFCDQSAFTRQFGSYTGTTPAAFRRQHSVKPARP
jgi:AraC-like DNA-binding protein